MKRERKEKHGQIASGGGRGLGNEQGVDQVEEVSLDDVAESVSVSQSQYGDEQIKDFKYALRLIESAHSMNSSPIVVEHYQAILSKIRPVLKGQNIRSDEQKVDY